MTDKNNERVYRMSFASVYPHYITKVERKGKTKEEKMIFRTSINQKSSKEIKIRIHKI